MTTASRFKHWLKAQLGRSYDEINCSELLVEGIRATGTGDECRNYRCGGTNELWRSEAASGKYRYIIRRMTIRDAIDNGYLRCGAVLAIWTPGHNEKYNDDEGDCDHIGIYIGDPDCEVIHSSATRGEVAVSKLVNGWTHVLVHRLIELDDCAANEVTEDTALPELTMIVVTEESSTLYIREKPTTASRKLGYVVCGGKVTVTGPVEVDAGGREWFPVRAVPTNRRQSVTGYMCADYLALDPEQIDDMKMLAQEKDLQTGEKEADCVLVPRAALLELADAANAIDNSPGVLAYLGIVRTLVVKANAVTQYLKGDD